MAIISLFLMKRLTESWNQQKNTATRIKNIPALLSSEKDDCNTHNENKRRFLGRLPVRNRTRLYCERYLFIYKCKQVFIYYLILQCVLWFCLVIKCHAKLISSKVLFRNCNSL